MRARWSDDDLRAAVADGRSWRSVARALGLKGTSSGTLRALKRRAASLDLDTAHFTYQRRWSDRQLCDAVSSADSWADVIRALDLCDSGPDVRVRVKGHAVRLGLDTSHLERRIAGRFEPLDLLADPRFLSKAAELFAAAFFAVRGAAVAIPACPAAYDLLVEFDGCQQRVQVKTTTWRAHHGTWIVTIGHRPYVLDKSASRMPYDPDDLDYYFIIDGDLVVYLVPSSVVAGLKTISVGAYQDYRVGDASSLFASAGQTPANVAGSDAVTQNGGDPCDAIFQPTSSNGSSMSRSARPSRRTEVTEPSFSRRCGTSGATTGSTS